MFSLNRSSSDKLILCGIAVIGACVAPALGQVSAGASAGAAGVSAGAGMRTAGGQVQVGATVQSGAPVAAGVPVQDDRLDRDTLIRRGLTLGVAGAAANYGAGKVSHAARGLVNVGKVKHVPHWGSAVASVPIFGKAAASGSVIPTTLGQVPVMGYVVKRVPVVGPVIAGPANPILVGAVAVDNYVIPKYSPCGYTKSSVIAANNDFNSPPKLRSYVNYLAPMPYTHPPIYSPATLQTDLPADLAYIDAVPEHTLSDAVSVPDL